MTDISISDIDRISHRELDIKIERLSFYLNRVNSRLLAISNFIKLENKTSAEEINDFITRKTTTKTIKVKR